MLERRRETTFCTKFFFVFSAYRRVVERSVFDEETIPTLLLRTEVSQKGNNFALSSLCPVFQESGNSSSLFPSFQKKFYVFFFSFLFFVRFDLWCILRYCSLSPGLFLSPYTSQSGSRLRNPSLEHNKIVNHISKDQKRIELVRQPGVCYRNGQAL